MVEDVVLADFVKRRQCVPVDRDAQVFMPYLVIREALVIVIDAEHHCAVERADEQAFYPIRRLHFRCLFAVKVLVARER